MTGPVANVESLAFLGFGEAAEAFLGGWRTDPQFARRVRVFDIKTESADPTIREGKRGVCVRFGVEDGASAAAAATGARLVFLLVTAGQAETAALAALPGIGAGALFFDCTSCARQTKSRIAARVEAAGGRYVGVAVMAPQLSEAPVGAVSSVKMTRSVMMKGLEALVCECVLSGRTYLSRTASPCGATIKSSSPKC